RLFASLRRRGVSRKSDAPTQGHKRQKINLGGKNKKLGSELSRRPTERDRNSRVRLSVIWLAAHKDSAPLRESKSIQRLRRRLTIARKEISCSSSVPIGRMVLHLEQTSR